MNKYDFDILNCLYSQTYINQRLLAEESGYSLGIVNRSLKALLDEGYISEDHTLTSKSVSMIECSSPQSAVILAAGFGMRMMPINTEVSKGMIYVHGERLVERLIRQLHQVGITDIYIVVGFLKEQYEYLIDIFGVKLIVNPDYKRKNNLYSLKKAMAHLSCTYIIPCDIWFRNNPFRPCELYSWYMVSDRPDRESSVRVTRTKELVISGKNNTGNAMIGVAYITGDDTERLKQRINELTSDSRGDSLFWEEALYENKKMMVSARVYPRDDAVEINTFEQLRELDEGSDQLRSNILDTISKVFSVSENEITNIEVLKKGMTNRSFLFTVRDKKYIMRIPGEGTEQLICRKEEAEVYNKLNGKNICDNIIFIDPENGCKITEYISSARTCDPDDPNDLKQCMAKLREFHCSGTTVEHKFDIFKQISFYESLWEGAPSAYSDHSSTKEKVFSLKDYIDAHAEKKVLSHIDAVPDNFLITDDGVKIIDWEYSGMHDPHVDIAMFCIYALYDKKKTDELIDIYFENKCTEETRTKIYCYISACGLLWSNWCEYKSTLGVEFGEYSLRQYRYAKEYYAIAHERIERGE